MSLAFGDLQSKFLSPVGVVVRVRDANGKPLDEIMNATSITNLMVETDMNGSLSTRQRPSGLPAVGGGPTKSPNRLIARASKGAVVVGGLTHNKDMMLPILRRKFPTMYHAFAFFDLDNGNSVGPREVRNFIQRLRNKGDLDDQFHEDNFLQELGIRTSSSTMDFHTFVQFFKFGDTLENWKGKLEVARQWRNKVLADEQASEAFSHENENLSLCDQVKKSLKEKFKDVAEAFVFFDTQATNVISSSGMKMGLRRIGLEHINVQALLKEVDENCADGIVDEHEFRRYFAWHPTQGYDEMIHRALANRREIASRNFRNFLIRHGSSASLLRQSSSILSSWGDSSRNIFSPMSPGASNPNSASKLQSLRNLLVKELKCRTEELVVAGVQDGDVVLAVLPDPRGVRPPQHLAERLKEMLMEARNPLSKWDAAVRGAQQVLLLPQGCWHFNGLRSNALLDGSITNGLLWPGEKSPKPLNPTIRSMGFLKALGAQDHWVALDGLGRVGSAEVMDSATFTILWHKKLDIAIELRHLSYGAFNFTLGPDLAVHGCTDEGRERPAKDAEIHSLDTLYRIRNGEGMSLSQRFAQFDSPAVGRWVVYMGVPRVVIRNVCDEELCLLLTSAGFIVLGAGKNPAALRVEGGGEPEVMSIAEAKRFIRHQPTQDDDPSELEGRHEAVVRERKEKFKKMKEEAGEDEDAAVLKQLLRRVENKAMQVELSAFFTASASEQRATEAMLRGEGFRECCSATKKLLAAVPVGSILPVGERMNRRAHIVRLCGDFGKAWVSGTGCSTELAFFLDSVRAMVEKGKFNVALASFFRLGHEDPVHVVAYLAKQLTACLRKEDADGKGGAGADEELLDGEDVKALSDASHMSLAQVLHRKLLELVKQDQAVLLVLDNLSLAEQRVLGHTMAMLRTDLQPWTYSLKRLGFVRIVFSGCDGYSAPSGVPMATIQLRRLTEKRAQRLLALLLRRMKKHIHSERLRVLLAKEGAAYVQYLRIAAEVLRDFWVFEQNNGYVEGLPSTLEGMYGTMIKMLERKHGVETVQTVLCFLSEHGVMTSEELRKLQGEEAKDSAHTPDKAPGAGGGERVQTALESALRMLLRTPPAVHRFEVRDRALKAAILARYDGTQDDARAAEAEAREREEERRARELLQCPVYVEEAHQGMRTACSSLQEAVDAAAAGDVIVVRQAHTLLQKGMRVWRNLTIRAEGWSPEGEGEPPAEQSAQPPTEDAGNDAAAGGSGVARHARPESAAKEEKKSEDGARKPQKLLQIEFGQSIIEISNGEEERLDSGTHEAEPVVVTLQGLGLKQVGFEAAAVPVTIHVSNGAEVSMAGCIVSSEEGVGVRVQGGTLIMEDSACVSCAAQGVMVEAGGVAQLQGCRLIANPASKVSEEEQALYDLFLRFCKGAVAETGADNSNRIGGEIKLSSMGSRATTLDLFEFMQVLTELGIYPAELTKTQVAELFAKSNASGASDDVASEMDWVEFKDAMLLTLQVIGRSEVMGLTAEKLVASKNAKDAFSSSWKYSDGITVVGSGSTATLRACEFVNAIHGCHVLARGKATLEQCSMTGCGRDRSDAAGVTSAGHGAKVVLKECTFDRCENYGVSVSKGGVVEAEGCKVINTGRQGVIVMGRGSRVDLTGTEVLGSGRSGVRAGQTGLLNLRGCKVANSGEAGIVSGFLGTRVYVESCLVHDNAVGILAENEGMVVVGGSLDGIEDTCICQRKGRLEKRRSGTGDGTAGVEGEGGVEGDANAGDASAEGPAEDPASEQGDDKALQEVAEEEEEEEEGEEVLLRFKKYCKHLKTGKAAFELFSQGTGAISRENIVDGLLELREEQDEKAGGEEDYDASWAEDDATELWYLLELEDDDVLDEEAFISKLGRKRWQPARARPETHSAQRRRKQNNVQGLLAGKIKGQRAKPETRKVMQAMAGWFDNVAEAFVMLDANAGGQVSLPEMERGLKRLGVFAELDFEELGREVGMQDGDELDIYRFVNYFIWHPREAFPEGSWQEGYMEARRCRRRIVERFNQRSGDGSAKEKKEGQEFSVLERDLAKRMQRKHQLKDQVKELVSAGDSKSKKKNTYLVHGGHVYNSAQDFYKGVSITKFATTHGLPGTPTKYVRGATPARYLDHTSPPHKLAQHT